MTSDPETPSIGSQGNLTRLSVDGRSILLVGTAHVSRQSIDEVRRVIEETRPEVVCVELDPGRYETLTDETRWKRLDVRNLLATGRPGLFLAGLLFAGFQKRLGDRLGVRPGAEMLAAIEAGTNVGARIVLADRDVRSTLARCHAALGYLDRAKIALLLAVLPFAATDIDERQVEELKTREAMADAMETFARQMPALKTPLIDERDRYLAASIVAAGGQSVVAVVGAAHAAGIAGHLGETLDREALAAIPPPRALDRAFPFLLSLAALAVLVLSGARRGLEAGLLPSFLTICVATSAATLVAALAIGSHPIVDLCGAVLGPLSVFLPVLRLEKTLGVLQARLTPPSPEHAAALRSDVLHPLRARANLFLKPVLLAVLAPLARTLGATIGLGWALASAAR